MSRRLALIACAALAACATTNEPQIESSDEQRCVQAARVGSNIRATKCYDRKASEQDKRATDHIVDRIRRAPTRSTSGMASGGI